MTMEIKKPNDIFAAVLQKPDANVFDLAASNIIPDNTQLLTPDDYKKSAKVQELFKGSNGKFDDVAFNTAYSKAAQLYSEIDSDNTLKNALEYDPMDFTAPRDSKKVDVRPIITKDINPFKQTYSRTGLNSIDENDLSLREIAQQNKIFDTKNNKWLDKSASDLGLFGSLLGDTLVYAQWDKNGEDIDPITHKKVKHSKGEWKYDEDGNIYVETLGDREVFGKQVVNPTDLITKEGTWLNKIDFFDSDGKDKSIFGATLKVATEIAPFFIPYVGEFYAGAKLALGMAEILPTLYKAGEGLFLGDSKGTETDAYKVMTKTEGFLSKFSAKSFSDAGQQSSFNYEQLGNTVSDIFSLIHEQRAAAKLAGLFYKSQAVEYTDKLHKAYNEVNMEAGISGAFKSEEDIVAFEKKASETMQQMSAEGMKQSQLAKHLGLGYMALSQATPVYNEALEGGYDKRTAAFASLLAVTGQYMVMNNHLGTWILDKSVGYSADEIGVKIRQAALDAAKSEDVVKGIEALGMPLEKDAGKRSLGKAFASFKDKINDFLTEPTELKNTIPEIMSNITKGSLLQGVEMTALTGATDMAKGVTDLLSSLGITGKKGSFGGWNNVFSEQGYHKYLSTLIGGLVGGPIFELERSVISPLLAGEDILSQKTKYSAQQGIADGLKKQMFDYLDKNVDKLGSSTLSPLATDVNGQKIYLPKEDMSQGQAIVEITKRYLDNLENVMNIEGLAKTDEDIFKKAIINHLYVSDLQKSGIDRFMLSDFRQKTDDIVRLRQEIDTLKSSEKDSDKVRISSELTKKYGELEEKRKWIGDFMEGKMEHYYHGLSLFSLNSALHTPFISLTPEEYVKATYNENYYNLSEADRESRKTEFETLMSNGEANYKNKFKTMYDAFLGLNKDLSKNIAEYNADGYASIRSRFYKSLPKMDNNMNIFSTEYEHGIENALNKFNVMNKEMSKEGLRKYNLDFPVDLSLGKFLVDRNLVELTPSNEESTQLRKERTKELANHYGILRNEDESENKFLNRVYQDVETLRTFELNKLDTIDKLKREIPDYSNKTIREVLYEISESANLTEEEKTNIKNLYPNANGDDSANIKANEKALKINDKYDKLLSKGTDITDDNVKDLVASQIDSVTFSNGEFNLKFIQSRLDELNYAKNKSWEDQKRELTENITDSHQLSEQLSALEELKKQLPNFKIKNYIGNEDLVLSPKRELVLHYAEDAIKHGEYLDNESIDFLTKEKDKLEKELISYNSATMSGLDLKEQNRIEDYLNKVDDEIEKINKVLEYPKRKVNSLLEKLRNYELQFFGKAGPVSIFKILQENIDSFNKIVNSSQFKKSDVEIYQLKRALSTIETTKAILAAMSSTKLGASNLYGYNVSLNKALEKEGLEPQYALLENESAVNMNEDLNSIETRLRYLKTLAEANASTMVEYQAKVQDSVIKGITKQILDKTNKLSIVNLKVGDNSLLTISDIDKINKITDNEQKLVELESIIYDNFHKLPGDINTKLDKLFTPFLEGEDKSEVISKLISSQDTNLTENFNNLESLDWYKYVHYLLAYNSKESYLDYKNNVKNEVSLSDNKKAPFYIQQMALREGLSYFENKRVVQHIVDFLQKDIEESAIKKLTDSGKNINNITDDELFGAIKSEIGNVDSFPIKNIQAIVGSGGTGKSSFIANWIVKTILSEKKLGDTVDIYAVAPTEDTLKVLTNDIKNGIEHSIKSITSDKLFKEILKEDGYNLLTKANEEISSIAHQSDLNKDIYGKVALDPKYFIKGEGDGSVLLTKEFLNSYVNIPTKEASPKVIIADEMSKFTTLEWQILNHIARSGIYEGRQYDNYHIITLGDDLQNGVVMGNITYGMENILVAKTTKLKVPIRARNIHKNNNNITLERTTEDWRRKVLNREQIAIDTPILTYYQGDKLAGDKFVDSLSNADLEKLDSNKEIIILSDDKEKDQENIDKITTFFKAINPDKDIQVHGSEVQGREFDQVIILSDLASTGNLYFNVKNLYTLLSRSKDATLIVGEAPIKIRNEEALYNEELTIDQNSINTALDNRNKVLIDLTADYKRKDKEQTTEKTPEVIPNPEVTIYNLPEFQEDEHSTPVSDYENKSFVKPKDYSEHATFGYSFFNNLGIEGDTINQFISDPKIEYYIGSETDEVGHEDPITKITKKTITWEDLSSRLYFSKTDTDLFSLPYRFTSEVILKSVLNDYIKFKNRLLFSAIDSTVTAPDRYLNNMEYIHNNELYIKKLDKYSNPYGKLVGSQPIKGSIRVLGKYIEVIENGEKIRKFITLAALPDITKKSVKDGLGEVGFKELSDIYKSLDDSKESEILVNPQAINIYGGVQVPRDPMNGDKTKLSQPISYDDVLHMFPGATKSDIHVFRDDIDFIKDTITSHDQTKVDFKDEHRVWEKYRFRPYFTLSYVEGVSKFEKVVVLQPKKRTLETFWSELVEHQQGYSDSRAKKEHVSNPEDSEVQLNQNEVTSSHLISSYKGWEIMRDFLNGLKPEDKKAMINKINDYFMFSHQGKYTSWEPFRIALDAIDNDSDINRPFKDFVKEQNGVLANAIDTKAFRVSNPIYIIHRLWANDSMKKSFGKHWDNYLDKNRDSELYYNSIITSIHSDDEGSKYGTLSKNQYKYYTMGFATESNKLKIDMSTLLKVKSPEKTQVRKKSTKIDNSTKIFELPDLKLSDGSPVKFEASLEPNENQIPIKIDSNIKSVDKDNLINFMHNISEINIVNKGWKLSEDGQSVEYLDDYGDIEDTLNLGTMLNNIYNSDNYILKNGKWNLISNLGEEYEEIKADPSKQKTNCKV